MSKQINKKHTFLVRLDTGWWKLLSQLRTDSGESFKALVEYALTDTYTGLSEAELFELFEELE